jgi:hypothetical protein
MADYGHDTIISGKVIGGCLLQYARFAQGISYWASVIATDKEKRLKSFHLMI